MYQVMKGEEVIAKYETMELAHLEILRRKELGETDLSLKINQ